MYHIEQHHSVVLSYSFSKLFNLSSSLSKVPKALKEANVTSVFKKR